jgi:hypothetical protein
MATPKKPAGLAKIIGESLVFKDANDDEILVPANSEASKMSLMVLAAQLRALLQETIKNYKDRGVSLTPAEIKQLTEAGNTVAKFQGEVYGGSSTTAPKKPTPRGMEKAEDVHVEEIDFSSLGKKGDSEIQDN